MTCQICNKESGEYSLCPECFELMQRGEVKQCINCKSWYKIGSVCNCIKVTPTEKENKSTTPNTPTEENEKIAEATNDPAFNNLYLTGKVKYCQNCKTWYKTGTLCKCTKKDYSKNSAWGCLIAILAIIGIIISSVTIPQRLEEQGNTGEKTNIFTALFKDAPSVNTDYDFDFSTDGEHIFLGFDVVVNCKANYNEVVAKIEFKDQSGAIFKTSYITFEDCKEGNVYRKKYNLSAEEILLTNSVRCTLYKYT